MTTWVLDASILVKAISPEPGSDKTLEILSTDHEFVAPAAALAECANALTKKVRRRQLTLGSSRQALGDLLVLPVEWVPVESFRPAELLTTALSFGGTAHDALYLHLAEARNSRLITADRRLLNGALTHRHWKGRVLDLQDWSS